MSNSKKKIIKFIEIDKKISENSKALIEAQIIKLKCNFSQSKNFMEIIGRNVYKQNLDDSIFCQQKELKELYMQRNHLKVSMEKMVRLFVRLF